MVCVPAALDTIYSRERLTWLALVFCRPRVGACACCGQGARVPIAVCACAGALQRCGVGAAAECALSRVGWAVGADCSTKRHGV
jgi:hypothetical protein